MIEEQAEVSDIDGVHAWVSCRAQQDCPRCAAGQGCGGGLLGRWLGDRLHRVRVVHQGGLSVGDCVVIGLEERMLVRATLIVYGIPLFALFAGAALGGWLGGGSEAWTVTGGALGLAGGFSWLKWFSRKIRGDRRYQPVVLRRVQEHG